MSYKCGVWIKGLCCDGDDDDGDDDDVDDEDDDAFLQVDILLFPEDGLSGFEFPKAHFAHSFLQRVR